MPLTNFNSRGIVVDAWYWLTSILSRNSSTTTVCNFSVVSTYSEAKYYFRTQLWNAQRTRQLILLELGATVTSLYTPTMYPSQHQIARMFTSHRTVPVSLRVVFTLDTLFWWNHPREMYSRYLARGCGHSGLRRSSKPNCFFFLKKRHLDIFSHYQELRSPVYCFFSSRFYWRDIWGRGNTSI